MVELQDVRTGYHGKEVLHGVSLRLQQGELLALVGPNGCGKSTLLRTVAGLQSLTGGSISHQGRDLALWSRRELAKQVSFLPQSRTIPQMSVERLVLHGRFPYLSYPRQYTGRDRQAVERALEAVGLADCAHKMLHELSGGQRQSAYLAMTLAQQSRVVLLDEPTTYLDLSHQFAVMDLLRALTAEGKSVCAVLHDLPLSLARADRLALMEEGRLLYCGAAAEAIGPLERVFQVRIKSLKEQGQTYYCVAPKEERA